MVITKISSAVKTPGRYNVFVNNRYSFSLDETQLVKLKLKKGDEISEKKLDALKSESDFGKKYLRAVDLISRRIRSEKEIRDYAFRKQWPPEITDKVIDRLKKYRYLDDERFMSAFIRSRAANRSFSKRRMFQELYKKGITKEVIEIALTSTDDFNEQDSLKRLIAKKRSHYETDDKLIQYLLRQGFRYGDIKSNL